MRGKMHCHRIRIHFQRVGTPETLIKRLLMSKKSIALTGSESLPKATLRQNSKAFVPPHIHNSNAAERHMWQPNLFQKQASTYRQSSKCTNMSRTEIAGSRLKCAALETLPRGNNSQSTGVNLAPITHSHCFCICRLSPLKIRAILVG